MSIPINDTFQVRIQGQLVDCIKAEAYSREVEKNSYSIFYCDYEKIKYLIGLKMVSDQADNSSLWVSTGSGTCLNADSTYTAFKAYDVLLTEKVGDSSWQTTLIANLITGTATGISSTNIYQSLEDVFGVENVPSGAMIIATAPSGEGFVIYTKTTENHGPTTEDDWELLTSTGGGVSSFMDLLDRPTIHYGVRATNEVDSDAINRILARRQVCYGDMVIIKTTADATIVGAPYDVITYIFDGSIWISLNGQLDVEKIIMTKDLQLDGDWDNVGNIKKSRRSWNITGKTLYEILDEIFNAVITPTIGKEPVLKVIALKTGMFEIGTSITQNWSLALTDGEYECAGETESMEAHIDSYVVTYLGDGGTLPGEPSQLNQDDMTDGKIVLSGNNGTFIIPEGYKKKFEAYAMVKTDKCATNNKGTLTTVKYDPVSQSITLGLDTYPYHLSAASGYIESYRMGFYFGESLTKYASNTITSDIVRALTPSNTPYPTTKRTAMFTVSPGTLQLLVAVPKGKPAPELYNQTVNSPFDLTKMGTIYVQAADGTAANAAEYDIYGYAPAIPFTTTNTVVVTINV